MKIIQTFKCNPILSNYKNKCIDFEITKYQQTKWIFNDEKVYFIESSIHWNMLLFYLYQNINDKNINYQLKLLENKYYSLTIEFDKIDKNLELILFIFFYQDIHNDKINVNKNEYKNSEKFPITYKWNNLYMNLINKSIEKEAKFIVVSNNSNKKEILYKNNILLKCYQPI